MRTAEGVTLHYVDVGPRDALPIVLVHGWPDLWFGWRVGLRSGVVVALHPLLVV
jgi:pimeloyl-ACP methyl ester carboxylesterase